MSESSEDEARPDQGDADDTNAIQQVGSPLDFLLSAYLLVVNWN